MSMCQLVLRRYIYVIVNIGYRNLRLGI